MQIRDLSHRRIVNSQSVQVLRNIIPTNTRHRHIRTVHNPVTDQVLRNTNGLVARATEVAISGLQHRRDNGAVLFARQMEQFRPHESERVSSRHIVARVLNDDGQRFIIRVESSQFGCGENCQILGQRHVLRTDYEAWLQSASQIDFQATLVAALVSEPGLVLQGVE